MLQKKPGAGKNNLQLLNGKDSNLLEEIHRYNDFEVMSVVDLLRTLRGDNGCPWDKKQTPETMIRYLTEEAYELLDAIMSGDPRQILDEAGDVLFQLLFIIELYNESNQFTLKDVIRNTITKMIRRHPHVFGNASAESVDQVNENWKKIKTEERNGIFRSLLDSVPSGLPSLQRAYTISEKVGKAGFDWDDMQGVIKKVEEEWQEFHDALKDGDNEHIALEFGDLLFTLTNIARFAGIHPETALAASVHKFETRYRHMEKVLFKAGNDLLSVSRNDIDELWESAKKETL